MTEEMGQTFTSTPLTIKDVIRNNYGLDSNLLNHINLNDKMVQPSKTRNVRNRKGFRGD